MGSARAANSVTLSRCVLGPVIPWEPALRESVIAIFLDGNTEAAFSAEFVTALGTEIRMGFVPISICW
jgi:hypothetical protein